MEGGIPMLVLIRGAGDLASGVALRLRRAGFDVAMTEIPKPTTIRRTVAFSEAVTTGAARVEEQEARLAADAAEAGEMLAAGIIPVLADPEASCRTELRPEVLVRREDADFWLIDKFMYGARRCIIVGKYPSKVENLKAFEG